MSSVRPSLMLALTVTILLALLIASAVASYLIAQNFAPEPEPQRLVVEVRLRYPGLFQCARIGEGC